MNRRDFLQTAGALITAVVGANQAFGVSPASAAAQIGANASTPRQGSPPGLRDLAAQRGLQLGCPIYGAAYFDANHAALLSREFTYTICPFRWSAVTTQFGYTGLRPTPDSFDFRLADINVKFAADHNLGLFGHQLINGAIVPEWLAQGAYSADDLRSILVDHVTTVVSHYRDVISQWAVVLEPFPYSSGRDFWYDKLGDAYIDIAFEAARRAQPGATLYLDDSFNFSLDQRSTKFDLATVERLRRKTVDIDGVARPLIDGIGIQTFLDAAKPPTDQTLIATQDAFSQLGVEVYLSGSSVSIKDVPGTVEQKYASQASTYKLLAEAFLGHGGCKRFVVWGLNDGNVYPDGSEGALFDAQYNPKPAYFAVADVLRATAGG